MVPYYMTVCITWGKIKALKILNLASVGIKFLNLISTPTFLAPLVQTLLMYLVKLYSIAGKMPQKYIFLVFLEWNSKSAAPEPI